MKPNFNPRFRKFASQAVQWFIQKFRQEGMKGESESPIHGPPDENFGKSIFGSVILRSYFKDDTSLVS